MMTRYTRASSSRWAQLDIQIGFQQSSLSGGVQSCLSTSFPYKGVKDAKELLMVGVQHLLGVFLAHIWEAESELGKEFEEQQMLRLVTFTFLNCEMLANTGNWW